MLDCTAKNPKSDYCDPETCEDSRFAYCNEECGSNLGFKHEYCEGKCTADNFKESFCDNTCGNSKKEDFCDVDENGKCGEAKASYCGGICDDVYLLSYLFKWGVFKSSEKECKNAEREIDYCEGNCAA